MFELRALMQGNGYTEMEELRSKMGTMRQPRGQHQQEASTIPDWRDKGRGQRYQSPGDRTMRLSRGSWSCGGVAAALRETSGHRQGERNPLASHWFLSVTEPETGATGTHSLQGSPTFLPSSIPGGAEERRERNGPRGKQAQPDRANLQYLE